MKNSIFKISAVVGIFLFLFLTVAGSVNNASDNSTNNPLVRASVQPVDGISATQYLTTQSKAAPDWVRAAFTVSAPTVLRASDAKTFSEMLGEALVPSHNYSEQEKKYIARVVYAEARGELFEGKVAVATVVLNRFESGRFGSTVKRVVFSRDQFAVSGRYSAECMEAVEAAIAARDAYPRDMYYFQVSKSKRWRSFDYYTRIGHHSFYCA